MERTGGLLFLNGRRAYFRLWRTETGRRLRRMGRLVRAAPAHTLQDLASSADTDSEQLCRELSGLTARGRCGQLLADAVQTSKAPKAASHGLCPPWARRLVTGDAGGVRLNPNLSRSDARLLGIRDIASYPKKSWR